MGTPSGSESGLFFSPEKRLHGERRCESALFDLQTLGLVQQQNSAAANKRAPTSTGFVDVKQLGGSDAARPLVAPAWRGLVSVAPPAPPPPQTIAMPDRDANVRRVLWAMCFALSVVVAVLATKILA